MDNIRERDITNTERLKVNEVIDKLYTYYALFINHILFVYMRMKFNRFNHSIFLYFYCFVFFKISRIIIKNSTHFPFEQYIISSVFICILIKKESHSKCVHNANLCIFQPKLFNFGWN